jgi:hypothetical protein
MASLNGGVSLARAAEQTSEIPTFVELLTFVSPRLDVLALFAYKC